ncbi:SusC/RagA family TonB-linked outer membrane protein [Reichenbachiella sp.]|uniref:SusC/RagA family TonB-linked outer membrane protein n=1 Tax=Reichenbachiella sp. TaxID=2184521 RepID=UPI003B5A7F87
MMKNLWIVMMMLLSLSAYAQEVTVQGTVTDEAGEGLPGVNVLDVNTGQGAVTDIDGNFKVEIGEDATISFSYIGYKSQNVLVGSRSRIDVVLIEDIQQLSEIVVIGYGQVEKKDATGVVAEVNAEDFNKGVLVSPDRLLAGKVAGVQIATPGGQPGAAGKIRIRGASSLNYSNEPLIVVDGVPIDTQGHNPGGFSRGRSALNFINPADVESMTVLKDASAAAIYGSRAANGVIIITTKKGDQGKLKVTYDGTVTMSQFTQKPDFFSSNQFRQVVDLKEPGELNKLGDANTDWMKEITQNAIGQRHMVTLSKADELNNFYLSGNLMRNEGVLKTSETNNNNVSARYERKLLNSDLTIKVNAKGGWSDDRYAPEVTNQAMVFDPTQPVMQEGSPYNGYFEWAPKLATRNPVAQINNTNETGYVNRYLGNIQAIYSLPFIEGMSVNLNGSYDYQEGNRRKVEDSLTYTGINSNQRGFLFNEDFEIKSKMLEAFVNYKKVLPGIDSEVDVVGGYSYQQWNNEFENYRLDSLQYAYSSAGELNPSFIDQQDSITLENRLISFFGRVNYTLKDKYLLTFTLRRDGSTRFAKANRWGLFPSMAAAWRIIDEDFMDPTKNVLSELKIRGGYGVTGNQEIPDYRYVSLYEIGFPDASYQLGNQFIQTLRPTGADPSIKWEETRSWNVGMDFGFLEGRLHGSFEYYNRTTEDLLFVVTIPAGTNVRDRLLKNIGSIENSGIELSLNSTIYNKENFGWDVSFNISKNKNKVLSLSSGGGDNIIYEEGGISGDVGQTIQVLKVGEPAFSFRTFEQKYNADGSPVNDVQDANGDGTANSLDMYVDQDDNGVINDQDLVIDKSPDPKWMLGLTSNLRYKKFDLSFTFRGNFGNYAYNNVSSANGAFDRITDAQVLNNIHKSAFNTNFRAKQLKSDYYLEDASFVKLDNISLGYTFDQLKFARIRLYATAQNILTITNYSGLDPEISIGADGRSSNGIDNNLYPRSLTAIFGVNVSF